MTIPDDLIERDQWVMWRHIRATKVPFQLNGKAASSTNPAMWCGFEDAHTAYTKHPDFWSGIGYVFHEADPFAGIDLDHCIDGEGEIKAWAYPILERFHDTYAEVSPSGAGIKIWCRARIPHALRGPMGDGGIEIYDRARYFTVTGRALRGEVLGIEDHQSDVDWLLAQNESNRTVPYRIKEKVPYGERHWTLVSIGGTLAHRGCTGEEIAALFFKLRNRFTGPSVPDENLTKLADELVRRYGGDEKGK